MPAQRINISGWTDDDEKALKTVYDILKKQGVVLERDGKPNVSAILLYLLREKARKGEQK